MRRVQKTSGVRGNMQARQGGKSGRSVSADQAAAHQGTCKRAAAESAALQILPGFVRMRRATLASLTCAPPRPSLPSSSLQNYPLSHMRVRSYGVRGVGEVVLCARGSTCRCARGK